jgi:hypothetical protein
MSVVRGYAVEGIAGTAESDWQPVAQIARRYRADRTELEASALQQNNPTIHGDFAE